MPKFRNVITGLAISAAMTGGALALTATTAHASTPTTTTMSSSWWHGPDGCRRARNCNKNRNKLENRNDFRVFKFKKEKKVHRKNVAFASGDAVIEIDGDDDD
ncbi:hypothetical protein [Microbispora sp. H11081]|uniref:hypothetical protein n=1 Tax=Microbispora sp. H11081 TaxID=2729107 RepID=UPI0014733B1D|nr:hypothetical protein [Microbispora sp. H11081]